VWIHIKPKVHAVFLLYCSPAPVSCYTHDMFIILL